MSKSKKHHASSRHQATRPCLISETRNFRKPFSSPGAVKPRGSKNPKGSLAPNCSDGWNGGGTSSTTASALRITDWAFPRKDVFPVKLVREEAETNLPAPSAGRPNCWIASLPVAHSAAKIPSTEIIAIRPLLSSFILISSLYIWTPKGINPHLNFFQ